MKWLLTLTISMTAVVPCVAGDPLAELPDDAAMFMHVKLGKLWNSPLGKAIQTKPTPEITKAIAELKTEYGLTPEMLETVTVAMRVVDVTTQPLQQITIAFNKPYNRAMIAAQAKKELDDVLPSSYGGTDYPEYKYDGKIVTIRASSYTMYTLDLSDPKTIVYSTGMYNLATPVKPAKKDGPLSKMVALARNDDSIVTIGMDMGRRPIFFQDAYLPEESKPFLPLFHCEIAWLNAKLSDNSISVESRFRAENPRKANEVERSLGMLRLLMINNIKEMRNEFQKDKELAQSGVVAVLESLLPRLSATTIRIEGREVVLNGSFPTSINLQALAPLLLPNDNSHARMEMRDSPLVFNLKQICLSMHTFSDYTGSLPTAATYNKRGKKLLSWRVQVLPYINEKKLYEKFHHDEPWDSEHNLKVMKENPMPGVYTLTGKAKPGETETHIQAIVGKETAINPIVGQKLEEIQDGSSNTIVMGVAAKAVPWTKPADIEVDGKPNIKGLLRFENGVTQFGFGDGSVRSVKESVDPAALKAATTRNGGETSSLDD